MSKKTPREYVSWEIRRYSKVPTKTVYTGRFCNGTLEHVSKVIGRMHRQDGHHYIASDRGVRSWYETRH